MVDLQVVQGASLETSSTKPGCKLQGRIATIGDVPVERIAFDLHFHGLSIEVKGHAGGATGSIIRPSQRQPLLNGQSFAGSDLDGIAWPEVDQGKRSMPILEKQFIATAACIRSCLRVMHHDESITHLRDPHRNAHGESLVAIEISDLGDGSRVFTIKPEGLSRRSINALGLIAQRCVVIGLGQVEVSFFFLGLEVKVAHQGVVEWKDEVFLLRRVLEPEGEWFPCACAKHRFLGLQGPDLLHGAAVLCFLTRVLIKKARGGGNGVGEMRIQT